MVAESVTDEDRRRGSYFPPIERSRAVAAKVAHGVVMKAYDLGISTTPRSYDLMNEIDQYMYQPTYRRFR